MVRGIAVLFALILSSASLAQGFDYDYRVYEGDNNQDGNLDFYVRKTSLILLHGDIVTPIEVQLDGFLLQQNPDGTFPLVSTFPLLTPAGLNQPSILAFKTLTSMAFAI